MTIFQTYPYLFPVYFAAMWLVVTTLLGAMTGWCGLMRRYPDIGEEALATLRRQSGVMGRAVSMSRILDVSPCPSGLRIGMMRLFGPFCRPFLVPWEALGAENSSFIVFPMVKLMFGGSASPALWLYPRTWEKLVQRSPVLSARSDGPAPLAEGALLKGAALQWLIITAFAAAFFYGALRFLAPKAPHVPLVVCIGFPAAFFGLGQIINVLMQRRWR